MLKKLLILLLIPIPLFAQKFTRAEVAAFKGQAKRVTIIRDKWGIPHVYGKTDADAVFGLLYAQCEDDFKRVELNYIEKLGRLSEVNGKQDIFNDLEIRLLIDSTEAIADYRHAQPWFKKLMDAYAAGINYYLVKNPQVKPLLLQRFKPWYALLWTDGSIGAINTSGLTTAELEKFYSGDYTPMASLPVKPDQLSGSNGFAFAPSITVSGHAILYINPHTTFYFRPEVQMQSDEGLDVYGAVTWGQFFVYQGFNTHCGWMHTSNNVDVADMYAEKITKTAKGLFYEYDGRKFPVIQKKIAINYLEDGVINTRIFTTYFTNNGPVMAVRDGKWISLQSKNRNTQSLIQSWLRTKATSFAAYKKVMDLRANASNNTVYADAEGNIAYWHGNFIPVRDPKYNWSQVVDGSTSATAWRGLHPVGEAIHVYNPPNGWLQNCNSSPFTVAGKYSPDKTKYPFYMAPDGDNWRGIEAVKLLSRPQKYTIDSVIAMGYDTELPAFEVLVPALLKAYDQLPAGDSIRNKLAGPVDLLKAWDYRTGVNSEAATLALAWGQQLNPVIHTIYIKQGDNDQVENTRYFAAHAQRAELLGPLSVAVAGLEKRFGKWRIAWGEVNRFQRETGAVNEQYNDTLPSIPVGFGPSLWGQLPSFQSREFKTQKRYGYSGNSFVCVVEFGKKIKAKSVLAGGESGDPKSKHFNDQALMYSKGIFKDVLFYKVDVLKNAERIYTPGN
jgi:acyl-homoserine-lactone acylase